MEDFNSIIQKWYKLYLESEHIFNLVLYHYKDENFFSIDRFIDMTRVLESFHRLKRKNERMKPEKYKKLLKEVSKLDLDSESKALLNDRLHYGNEPTFKTRLEELFSEIPKSIMSTIDANKKLSKYIKDTRNYYTHYDNRLQDKILSTSQLVAVTNNIKLLIIFLLLKEVGIKEELLESKLIASGLFEKWEDES